jgi:large subunit ribosomal protein L23
MQNEEILLEPIVTEEAWQLKDAENKYTFRVHSEANKVEIRRAIETLFKVKVAKVWTMSVPGRPRKTKYYQQGHTRPWKKAIVKLKPGERIDIYQQ